jgi:hypothetical protein
VPLLAEDLLRLVPKPKKSSNMSPKVEDISSKPENPLNPVPFTPS